MNCGKYRKHELGEISPEEFVKHLKTCTECAEAHRVDQTLEMEAADLPAPKPAPGLWYRIASEIENNQVRDRLSLHDLLSRAIRWINPQHHLVLKVAALLVIAVGLTYVIYPRGAQTAPGNILTEQALNRAEALENEYVQAIEELESLTGPLMADIDVELKLHYRKRIETIDRQIERCRSALENDRGNSHIRRYLLAAYQDKRETFTELARLSEEKAEPPKQRKELGI